MVGGIQEATKAVDAIPDWIERPAAGGGFLAVDADDAFD